MKLSVVVGQQLSEKPLLRWLPVERMHAQPNSLMAGPPEYRRDDMYVGRKTSHNNNNNKIIIIIMMMMMMMMMMMIIIIIIIIKKIVGI